MTPAPRHALLIAVDDYRAWDTSVGLPIGTSNLAGSVRDLDAWCRVTAALGVAPAHLTVLASRAPASAPLPSGIATLPATYDNILAALEYAATAAEEAGAELIVVFCGHGTITDDGPALCPSDVTGPDAQRTLPLSMLRERLEQHAPTNGVTAFLDACHSGRGRSLARALTQAHDETFVRLRPQDRVVSACRMRETAFEILLVEGWRGAFSWAVTTLLQRFAPTTPDAPVGLSWFQLTLRARELVDALAVDQTPTCSGPIAGLWSPVFSEPGTAPAPLTPGQTRLIEIDPSTGGGYTGYRIQNLTKTATIGWLIVTGAEPASFNDKMWAPERDFWFWDPEVGPFPTAGFLLTSDTSNIPSFLIPANAWRYDSQPFSSGQFGDWNVNLSGGRWFIISQNTASNGVLGWMKAKTDALHWYEIAASLAAAPNWLAPTSTNPELKFFYTTTLPNQYTSGGETMGILDDTVYVNDPLVAPPA